MEVEGYDPRALYDRLKELEHGIEKTNIDALSALPKRPSRIWKINYPEKDTTRSYEIGIQKLK